MEIEMNRKSLSPPKRRVDIKHAHDLIEVGTWSSGVLQNSGGTMYLHDKKGYPSSTQNPCTVKVNSRICIKDVDSGEVFTFCLVSPDDLDARNGKISILTSLGAALIGKGVGNVVTWRAPSGPRRFEVQSVL